MIKRRGNKGSAGEVGGLSVVVDVLLLFCLLAKQSPDALQHTVLLGIVRVVLGGDLENGGECLIVLVNQ